MKRRRVSTAVPYCSVNLDNRKFADMLRFNFFKKKTKITFKGIFKFCLEKIRFFLY